MYLASEALRLTQKTGQPVFSEADAAALANYERHVDRATRSILVWGKVAVALALDAGR